MLAESGQHLSVNRADPLLVRDQVKGLSVSDCPVFLSRISLPLALGRHWSCLREWMSKVCPRLDTMTAVDEGGRRGGGLFLEGWKGIGAVGGSDGMEMAALVY